VSHGAVKDDTEDQDPVSGGPAAQASMPTGIALRALPLFCFLHIQKTAGTTARGVFRRMFGNLVYYTTAPQLREQTAWRRPGFYDKYLLIGGHVPFGHEFLQSPHIQRRRIFLSLWRDPVARVISHYDYIRRMPKHWLYNELSNMSLLDAFEKSERFNRESVDRQLVYTFGTAQPERVEEVLASENYLIASTVQIEPFFDAVSALSGLPRPASVPHVNVRPDSAEGVEPRASLAREQPDFELARERIRAANAAEYAFMEQRLNNGVLVTTCLRAVPPRGAVGKGRPGAGKDADADSSTAVSREAAAPRRPGRLAKGPLAKDSGGMGG
jgi:hypothetical protein